MAYGRPKYIILYMYIKCGSSSWHPSKMHTRNSAYHLLKQRSSNDSVTCYFTHRKAWQSLGDMSQEEARKGLISLLDAATPRLREFALEQWKSKRAIEQRENRYTGDYFRRVEGGINYCSALYDMAER